MLGGGLVVEALASPCNPLLKRWDDIDLNKPQLKKIDGGVFQPGSISKTPAFNSNLSALKNGDDIFVSSVEEAKLLFEKGGFAQKHTYLIENPHIGSTVSPKAHTIYPHINLKNGGTIIITEPFIP